MNTVLLIGLAICEIFFAGVLVWEFYTLLQWLDRRVFSPLLWKANDLILRLYVHHKTEEWLFWERRKEEADASDRHVPACQAIEQPGPGSGERDAVAPGE